MKRLAWTYLMTVVLIGCVAVPSRDSIRSKYKAPAPLAPELAEDPEIKDLILNASAAGKSDEEKRRLFERFEKALARCARERGGMAVAFDLCVTQYHLFPDERKALLNLASIYRAMGKKEESFALLKEAMNKKDVFFRDESGGHLARIHRGLGGYYLDYNNPSEAVKHLEKVIELNPEDAHSHFLLGQAYGLRFRASGSKDDLTRAIGSFEKGFRLGPKLALPEDYSLFATLQLQHGNDKAATDMLKAGIQRFPAVPAFYFNLAQYIRASGNPIGAYYLYAMADLVRRPGDVHARLATEEMKQIEAEAQSKEAGPNCEQIRCLVRGAEAAESPEEAVSWLRKALKANGKNEFVIRYRLTGALARAKQYDEAEALCEACLKERPWFAPAYVELGEAYEARGDRQKAMQWWVKALETQPYNWRVQEIWSRATDEARKAAMGKLKGTEPPQ